MLREFGDAGVARLIVPRTLIVEYARSPEVQGPPPGSSWPYPNSASPGVLTTAAYEDVAAEIARARRQCGPFASSIHLVHEGETPATGIGEASLLAFLRQFTPVTRLDPPGVDPVPGPRPRGKGERAARAGHSLRLRHYGGGGRELQAPLPAGSGGALCGRAGDGQHRHPDQCLRPHPRHRRQSRLRSARCPGGFAAGCALE